MKTKTAFKIAVNNLVHSKLRSWLTIIGIVIGVAAVIGIVSLGTGLQASIGEQLGGLGADIITITPGFSRAQGFGGGFRSSGQMGSQDTALMANDVQALKGIPEITFINPTISGSAELSFIGEKITITVRGVDPLPWSQILTSDVISGRVLSPGDSNAIVLTEGLATSDIFKNDILVGKQVMINDRLFRVIGILEDQGFGGSRTVYMSLFMSRSILEDKPLNEFDSISVKISDSELVDSVTEKIENKLLLSHHVTEQTKDFTVSSSQALQSQISSILGTFTFFLAGIAAISLLVGAVGIANTMFTSVLEKTRDIGILKAIGARNSDILSIFLINSGLVGLVGGTIGVILGVGVSVILPSILPFGSGGPGGFTVTSLVTLEIVTIALLMSFGIGIITGIIPAYRASKMKPVDALRYE